MGQPFVSIVTPVYNGEAHLEECIESVLGQTYENFEYILIDNASADRSGEIAASYAAGDERMRVVTNPEVLPALANFNHMMRQISGESRYCKVLHADDWMMPECVERMVALAEAHPEVGVVGSYRLVGRYVEADGIEYGRNVIPGREAGRMNLLSGPYTFGTPSALLFRSDLIRARPSFYTEEHSGADTQACLDVLRECDFGFVFQVLTFSRVHDESITSGNAYFRTGYPNFLHAFRAYGRAYLSQEEYARGDRELVRRYYRFLGRSLVRWRDKKFWQYHREAMDRVGVPFSRLRILGAGAGAFARWAVDVKSHLKRLTGLFRTGSRGDSTTG